MKLLSCPVGLVSGQRRSRAVCFAVATVLGSTVALAQDAGARDGDRRRGTGGQDDGSGRRTFSPQDIQARMLATLRERLGITNDEEWAVVAERIGKVSEIRRTSGAGLASAMAFRGPGGPGGFSGGRGDGQGGGDANRGGYRGPRPGGGSPESQALQAAVADKLPEAEVKARLAKLRETRKANEKKLEQAQEELRAVLTVRQEAVMVLMGLLP